MLTATNSKLVSDGDGAERNVIDALFRRAESANSALLRGDLRTWLTLITPADDFTLMDPFGGPPRHGFDPSSEHLANLARFFKSGAGHLELVQSYASGDMVVLVVIERQHAEIGGLPDQDWSLRVTLVYRREGAEWRLIHRHADALVKGISLEHAASLARGATQGCSG
jgi:ketosteroid isomerase-like protein